MLFIVIGFFSTISLFPFRDSASTTVVDVYILPLAAYSGIAALSPDAGAATQTILLPVARSASCPTPATTAVALPPAPSLESAPRLYPSSADRLFFVRLGSANALARITVR